MEQIHGVKQDIRSARKVYLSCDVNIVRNQYISCEILNLKAGFTIRHLFAFYSELYLRMSLIRLFQLHKWFTSLQFDMCKIKSHLHTVYMLRCFFFFFLDLVYCIFLNRYCFIWPYYLLMLALIYQIHTCFGIWYANTRHLNYCSTGISMMVFRGSFVVFHDRLRYRFYVQGLKCKRIASITLGDKSWFQLALNATIT